MRKTLPLLLLPLFASASARSQDKPAPHARLDTAIEAARSTAKIPGLNVAIGKNGRIVYERGFGLADLENKVRVTTKTRFRTASIAKPMTAVCVMQLHERGKLDLDRAFAEIYVDWPKKRWPLTCRQLLAHLGGVRHYKQRAEANGTTRFATIAASLAAFAKDPLLHEPGTKYQYTTYGYSMLGVAIENASGTSFAKYIKEHVWEVAGMRDSSIDDQRALIPNRARGYELVGGELRNCALHDTSMKIPGGGLLSTASDLARFGLAMLANKLVKPKTRELMWTTQKTKSGEALRYGLGFHVAVRGANRMIGHGGNQAGASCGLMILPERRVTIAIMSNLSGARFRPIQQLLMREAMAR